MKNLIIGPADVISGWMMGDENCAALRVEHKSSKTLRSNRMCGMIWTATDLLKSFPRDRHRHSLQDFESVLRMWQWLERSNPLGKGVNSCAKWKLASRKSLTTLVPCNSFLQCCQPTQTWRRFQYILFVDCAVPPPSSRNIVFLEHCPFTLMILCH